MLVSEDCAWVALAFKEVESDGLPPQGRLSLLACRYLRKAAERGDNVEDEAFPLEGDGFLEW